MPDVVTPFRIGFLNEGGFPDEAAFDASVGNVIRFRCAEAVESGELDRPVELITRTGRGLPHGTAAAVRRAWGELADDGVLLILGPGITDNCIAVAPLFEARRVPTISFPGTTASRGEYGFHYQLGSLYDDGPLIAKALARRELTEIAVIRDRSPIGDEFFQGFEEQCELSGLRIVSDAKCSPVATELGPFAGRARASRADALVYLGFGAVLLELSRALRGAGWDPPRFTTSAGMHYYTMDPGQRQDMTGWVYVDQVDETNEALAGMRDRYEKRYGRPLPLDPFAAAMYDMATLAVLGLRYASVHTPEGVKDGLNRIRQVPAVLGGRGTVQGFGPWERTALKGPDYLILRHVVDGTSVRYRD